MGAAGARTGKGVAELGQGDPPSPDSPASGWGMPHSERAAASQSHTPNELLEEAADGPRGAGGHGLQADGPAVAGQKGRTHFF